MNHINDLRVRQKLCCLQGLSLMMFPHPHRSLSWTDLGSNKCYSSTGYSLCMYRNHWRCMFFSLMRHCVWFMCCHHKDRGDRSWMFKEDSECRFPQTAHCVATLWDTTRKSKVYVCFFGETEAFTPYQHLSTSGKNLSPEENSHSGDGLSNGIWNSLECFLDAFTLNSSPICLRHINDWCKWSPIAMQATPRCGLAVLISV